MFVKSNVLLLGSGGVGTIVALNLEAGGLASVTAVLRSNYADVKRNGFTIRSCDHGQLDEWRPSHSKSLVKMFERATVDAHGHSRRPRSINQGTSFRLHSLHNKECA